MKLSVVCLAAAAVFGLAPMANAGGYSIPVVSDAAPVAVVAQDRPDYDWSGAYAGGTIGYAFGGDDVVGISQGQTRLLTSLDKLELGGPTSGVRAGYRTVRSWGPLNWVFAGELSYSIGSESDEFTSGGYTAENQINNVMALRFKAGVLRPSGDTLFYGIAGISRAEFDYSVTGTSGVAGPVSIRQDGDKVDGLLVGLGVERKLSDKWSVTGEWEYQRYDKMSLSDANDRTTEATPKWHQIRLGVNYQF